ncbi:unnamed protein product [Parascedosporium putredinis]|uniref:Glucosamine-6-phosphate isomerase n=1 Tax=Parascedosporium putredinis TaxID=1442378 RepID=A0A9P1H620_9PEZI|nr:unnamed protein product [Parascedosporium putredinis]CAI7999833.1 unnamed protein product [Parascedosporium putredinis]
MRVIIRDESLDASEYVAGYIVERVKEFDPSPDRPFVLGLPTGSSPLGVYKALVRKYKAGQDEYVGLPRDHPESYHTFMWTNLFSHIDIYPQNVHILNGNAESLAIECARFESLIRERGGIDLFLAGVGEDGHIAFNEPASSLSSRTRVKTLTQDTIRANARFFGGDVAKVPRLALTVGVGTVLEATEVVAVIFGRKSQSHCKDATMELQVKTVKYFKSIESRASVPSPLNPHPPKLPGEDISVRTGILEPMDLPVIVHPSPLGSPSVTLEAAAEDAKISTPFLRRSASPDMELIPDRMASRIPGGQFSGRLSPRLSISPKPVAT